MPRPADDVWGHFLMISNGDQKKNVTCNYCNLQYKRAQATRLREHLVKCQKCPINIKNTIRRVKNPASSTVPSLLSAQRETSSPDSTREPSTMSEETELLQNTVTHSPVAVSDDNEYSLSSGEEDTPVRVKAERRPVREESSKRFRPAFVRGRPSRQPRTSSSTFENWMLSLERRRVAAEEKTAAALKTMADAKQTMADAALYNAQTLRLVAEACISLKSDMSQGISKS